jgi:hypothetical protein
LVLMVTAHHSKWYHFLGRGQVLLVTCAHRGQSLP